MSSVSTKKPPRGLDAFPKPSVAVDVALLTVVPDVGRQTLAVLVHRRADGYGAGRWSLPGRFVRKGERLHEAALTALADKVGVQGEDPRQLRVFDAPDRDDRGWAMSVAHVDLVPYDRLAHVVGNAGELLAPVTGKPVRAKLPGGRGGLLFDHDEIIEEAVRWVRAAYQERPDPRRLLGDRFTLSELRRLHEAVLGPDVPQKDTFRRRMEPHLEATGERRWGSVGAPAMVYRRNPELRVRGGRRP